MSMNRRKAIHNTLALSAVALLPYRGASATGAARRATQGGPLVSIEDYKQAAREKMPAVIYEFVESGAADEHTLRWNREAYEKLRLYPRVLQDLTRFSTQVKLFGQTIQYPILLAPTAYQKLVHSEGEVGAAKGARAAQLGMVLSSFTTTPVEEVKRAAPDLMWFQLYFQERGFTRELVHRVEAAGCTALCLTVDTPVLGARNRQQRAGFSLPADLPQPHRQPGRRLGRHESITWKDVEWLLSFVGVPLLLKGILRADDADTAIRAGASGIIVSNHGARNLDTTPATIDVLPAIAEVVQKRVPVLVDGGIQRGTDVVKALARGADAILIGRPYLYGLAVEGRIGVERIGQILSTELEMAMALTGQSSITNIDRSIIWQGQ